MANSVAIIIVTFNSDVFFADCLAFIFGQNILPAQIIIIDNNSSSREYLKNQQIKYPSVDFVFLSKNIGFAAANNLAFNALSENIDVVLFLNPDAYLPKNYIEQVIQYFNGENAADLISGKLLRYNNSENKPTNVIDSTGIVQKWYGRWLDRGTAEVDSGQYDSSQYKTIKAVCGAAFIVRKSVLDEVVKKDGYIFNEKFFMYKEDIELSLRIARLGYKIEYIPHLVAYHCRGWKKRSDISFLAKKYSARNDVLVAWSFSKKALPYALFKYLLFFLFRF